MKSKSPLAAGFVVLGLLVAGFLVLFPSDPPPPAALESPAYTPAGSPEIPPPSTQSNEAVYVESAWHQAGRSYETQGPASALSAAKLLQGKDRSDAVLSILTRAARDGQTDFVIRELADCGLDEYHMDSVISSLVDGWADPAAAIAWAQGNLAGKRQRSAVSSAIQRLAKIDPLSAVSVLEGLPAGEARDEAFGNLIAGWGSHDYKAALEYARTSTGRSDHASALIGLAKTWVTEAPALAKAYLEDSRRDGDEGFKHLAHLLAVAQVEGNPEQTLIWAATLDGPAGERAQRSAIIAWADENVETVARFIATAEPSISDAYAPILASAWTAQDPAAAAAWASGLPPNQQLEVIAPLIYQWFQVDQTAAAAWLATLPDGPAKQHGSQILAARTAFQKGVHRLTDVTPIVTRLMENEMYDQQFFQKPESCH